MESFSESQMRRSSASSWNSFRKLNRGSGKSMKELSEEYHSSSRSSMMDISPPKSSTKRSSRRSPSPRSKRSKRSSPISRISKTSPKSLSKLPNEIVVMILSDLPVRDIVRFCQTNKNFQAFCTEDTWQSENMWEALHKRDFPSLKKLGKSYLRSYQTYASAPVFDDWNFFTLDSADGKEFAVVISLKMSDEESVMWNVMNRAYFALQKEKGTREYLSKKRDFMRIRREYERTHVPYGRKWQSVSYFDYGILLESWPIRYYDAKSRTIVDNHGFIFRLGRPDEYFNEGIFREFEKHFAKYY